MRPLKVFGVHLGALIFVLQVTGEFVSVGADLSMGVRAWENGTLSFARAERRHEGRYLCEANNGVGGGLSKVISLHVNEPPWFALRSQRLQVEVDSLAKLTCQAKGDPPLNIIWTRDGAPLPPYPRYEVSERESDGGTSSELLVRRPQVQDSGTFVCEASNPHGTLSSDFHLVVQDVPNSPSGLNIVEKGSRHMTLAWTSPSDSNAPIMAYTVNYAPHWVERKGDTREVTVEGDQVRVRLEGLWPATTYSFSVSAENRVGRSPLSTPIRQSTLEETPKGHPLNVRVSAISSTALQVTWEPPKENETHGLILGYYLGYKDESQNEPVEDIDSGAYNFTTVGVEGLGVTSATLTSLRPYTKYSVVLQAFNSRGAGPSSPTAFASTLEDKPSAPPDKVSCESLTSSSLKITWSPPAKRKANGKIISYRVTYRLENPKEEYDGSGMVISETLFTSISDLEPWSNYSISVAASTRTGEGVQSAALICRTLEDVPAAPDRLKVVASGARSATVSWSAPKHPNGQVIGYTVHWVPVGGRTGPLSRYVEAPQTHLTLHDLLPSDNKVWVTASTGVGKGPSSNVEIVTPSRKVSAGVWSVGGNVTVGWKDDVQMECRTVGKPEPEIVWSHLGRRLSASSDRLTILPDGTLRIVDTQKDDTGSYTCKATNVHGSDIVSYNLRILVPPSRPFLHVTETTSSSIRLQWSVEDDGGAPIRKSILYYRPSSGETEEAEVLGSRSSHTVSGLRCGTSHHFFVTTTNRIGTSDASKEVEARTKGRAPEAPPLFQFVTTNSSQATLYLTQWESGGCDITHFHVEYRRMGVSTWTTVGSEIKPTRTFAVGGLSGGKKYQIRVRAHNAAGSTVEEYIVTTPSSGNAGFREAINEGDGWNMIIDDSKAELAKELWEDPRILVPAIVSVLAIILTIATVCICLKKKPVAEDGNKKALQEKMCSSHHDGKELSEDYQIYSPIRRPPPTPPHAPPPSEARDSAGDYSEEDVYQYATATFQIRRGTPPPPAPPSPPTNGQTHRRSHQKGFTALVFQPPSLHDVDSPNMEGRCSVPPDDYPQGDVSETDEYGSLAEGDLHKSRQQRMPRPRNHKTKQNDRVESRKHPLPSRESPKSSISIKTPRPTRATLRPKMRPASPMPQVYGEPVNLTNSNSEAAECDLPW